MWIEYSSKYRQKAKFTIFESREREKVDEYALGSSLTGRKRKLVKHEFEWWKKRWISPLNTNSISLSLSHTHIHTLSLLSLALTHTHTHTLSLPHSHTHTLSLLTHIISHKHTHTHTPACLYLSFDLRSLWQEKWGWVKSHIKGANKSIDDVIKE